jgi:phosphonate transport system substrate-binding protein
MGLGFAFASPSQASDEARVLSFGIVPQQSASRLAKMWGPLLRELENRVNVSFQFRTTKDIPTFEACLAAGSYDVAYMNPMHYAIFAEEAGFRAIARQADKRLKGIIVTRSGSDIEEIADLGGATVAFPSPGAFGASILTRSTLTAHGLDFDPAYVKSHDSVYRAVAAGLMPAGGGVTRTFNALDPSIRAQLDIIYETQGFTPHAIATNDQLDDNLAESIQAALIQIAAEAPELVAGVGMAGFEVGADADWDDVRALDMSRAATGILQAGEATCPSD